MTDPPSPDPDFIRRLMFVAEVHFQCKAVLTADRELHTSLGLQPAVGWERDYSIWIALQHLVGAAANISKLLWGTGGKKAELRRSLIDQLGLTDNSPLKDTKVRNHFEHVDERFDDWLNSEDNLMHRVIGPRSQVVLGPGVQMRVLHHFDPTNGVLFSRDTSVSVPEIVIAAANLRKRCEEVLGFY